MSQNVVNYGSDPNGAQLLDDLLALDQQNRLTSDSGASRPNYALIGTRWIEKTSDTLWKLKMFNGTDDIVLCTFNPQADSTTTVAKALLASGAEGALATTLAGKAPLTSVGVLTYDVGKTYGLYDLVSVASATDFDIYKSLVANNTGNPLTDATKWEEVSLGGGGGGGGEIGDVGLAPFGIDETLNLRRYLNGQVISQSQFESFTTKLKAAVALYPSLATTEANWQSEKSLSKLGQCGKFVIDDDAGTIRLPAVVNAQGLTDLQYLGTIKSESLPNVTGGFNGGVNNYDSAHLETGAFASEGASWGGNGGGASATQGMKSFSASRSSSTYQDNAPVQQEAVQYPYYIQVATGVEETLPAIREYEINTPFFFGQSMYSDVAPDNASWLVSNGQYNAKTVYPDYYDWLLAHIGETITANGGKVVLSTDAITDYDWVVSTSDETFRLPVLDGSEDLLGDEYDNLTITSSGSSYTAPTNGWFTFAAKATQAASGIHLINSTKGFASSSLYANNSGIDLGTTIKVEKGDLITASYMGVTNMALHFYYAIGNGSLYFYVGDTVQDASLINAGAVLGQLANKADANLNNVDNTGNAAATNLNTKGIRTVIETYRNGTNFYRVSSDGFIEQGGYVTNTNTNDGYLTFSFLKQFTSRDYIFIRSGQWNDTTAGTSNAYGSGYLSKTVSSVNTRTNGNSAVIGYAWYACGY